MAIVFRHTGGKSQSPLVPVDEFPLNETFEAVRRREIDGVSANVAVTELLTTPPVAELLTKHGLTIEDYVRPGQTMSGLKKRISKLTDSNAAWWDKAKAAGLRVDNPRPATQESEEVADAA